MKPQRLGAIIMLGMVGCGSTTPGSGTPAPSAPSSSSAEPSASAEDLTGWGPLAVIDLPAGDTDLAALSGKLVIEGGCVTIEEYTLVWRNSQTRWDATRAVIVFEDVVHGGEIVELANGDDVELGGGEVLGDLPWEAAADPSCPASQFGVGTITSVNGVIVGS